MSLGIPKVIIQTDKTRDIRPEWKTGPPSLKEVALPGWEYKFFDDDDIEKFVSTTFPHYYKTWKSFPHNIMRVDTFRYMWLYEHGGFYSDMDYEYLTNIEHLFYNEDGSPTAPKIHIIKSANVSSSWSNSIMASVPKHPFWLFLLNKCSKKHWSCVGRMFTILNWTGPGAVTRAIKKWKKDKRYVKGEIVALPKELNMCNICDHGDVKPGSWAIPLQGQSWATKEERILNGTFCFFKNFWWIIVLVILIVIILIVTMLFTKDMVNLPRNRIGKVNIVGSQYM